MNLLSIHNHCTLGYGRVWCIKMSVIDQFKSKISDGRFWSCCVLALTLMKSFTHYNAWQTVFRADFSHTHTHTQNIAWIISHGQSENYTTQRRGGTKPCNRAFFSICCFFLTAYLLQKGCSSLFGCVGFCDCLWFVSCPVWFMCINSTHSVQLCYLPDLQLINK